MVSCHLGNGASICAIDHGRSVDTSMGFTPGEGLIMGTRCGDLDSGVLTFLQRTDGLTAAQLDELLNKKSGLLGLSGISSDMREVEKAADAGDAHALTALKTFCYRVRKYIGAYVAAMGGLDVLIFTAGIGQGSAGVRATALQGLDCMGIKLDEARNREACGRKEIARISTDDSPVTVLVVPTDEERMIARETLRRLESRLSRPGERSVPERADHRSKCLRTTSTSRKNDVEALFGPGHQLTKTRGSFTARPVRLQGTAHHRRPERPHRTRARPGARAQSHTGRDRHDRAVQARHSAADPRIGRHRGLARLHTRRSRPAASRSTKA